MVTKILEQIEQISQMLQSYKQGGTMSAIERDLIQDKLRGLYEITLGNYIASDTVHSNSSSESILKSPEEGNVNQEKEEVIIEEREEIESRDCELYDPAIADPGYSYDGALSTYMSQSELQSVFTDLFGSDAAYANCFLKQLDEFTDLDQAILYIQETIPEKLNSPSVTVLADALTSKLA